MDVRLAFYKVELSFRRRTRERGETHTVHTHTYERTYVYGTDMRLKTLKREGRWGFFYYNKNKVRGKLKNLLGLTLLGGLLLGESSVDEGDNTSTGDGGLDQSVQFIVTTDGKLQVTRSDTLDLKIS